MSITQHEGELRDVALAGIDVEQGFNPRTSLDEERLAELTELIRQRGLLQPLLLASAEDGALQLVAGHRRLAAARATGLETVPALIRQSDERALEDALVENIGREDLNRRGGDGARTRAQAGQAQPEGTGRGWRQRRRPAWEGWHQWEPPAIVRADARSQASRLVAAHWQRSSTKWRPVIHPCLRPPVLGCPTAQGTGGL